MEIQSESTTQIMFSFSESPSNVFLNGTISHDWQYDTVNKTLMMKISAGRLNISIIKWRYLPT